MKHRTSTPWLAQLDARASAASRRRRIHQLERSLQARRDARDLDGEALAKAWLLEARSRGAA